MPERREVAGCRRCLGWGGAEGAGDAESDAAEALLRRKRLVLAAACTPPR